MAGVRVKREACGGINRPALASKPPGIGEGPQLLTPFGAF